MTVMIGESAETMRRSARVRPSGERLMRARGIRAGRSYAAHVVCSRPCLNEGGVVVQRLVDTTSRSSMAETTYWQELWLFADSLKLRRTALAGSQADVDGDGAGMHAACR
jgi:hypothetical protein